MVGAGDICIYRQNRPFPIKITWGFIGNGRNVSICEQAWAWPGIILDGDLAEARLAGVGRVSLAGGKPGWGKTGWPEGRLLGAGGWLAGVGRGKIGWRGPGLALVGAFLTEGTTVGRGLRWWGAGLREGRRRRRRHFVFQIPFG